jgi:hypothetical protein
MRTLEFGAYPTAEQRHRLEAWLLLHRRIWNNGLALLMELTDFSACDKASTSRVPGVNYISGRLLNRRRTNGGWRAD